MKKMTRIIRARERFDISRIKSTQSNQITDPKYNRSRPPLNRGMPHIPDSTKHLVSAFVCKLVLNGGREYYYCLTDKEILAPSMDGKLRDYCNKVHDEKDGCEIRTVPNDILSNVLPKVGQILRSVETLRQLLDGKNNRVQQDSGQKIAETYKPSPYSPI